VQMTSAWRLEVMSGKSSAEAASAAFSSLFIPGATALLTEALGFGVIMFIAIPIVHELGITACLGVLLMIITNKMILPIILSYLTLEESSKRHSENALFDEGSPLLKAVSYCAERRGSWAVFAATLVLLVFATWQSRYLVIGDSGTGVPELHEDSRYNEDSRAIASTYNIGVDLLTVIVEAKDFPTDSCLQYPVINLIDRFELYMRGVEGVQSVTSVQRGQSPLAGIAAHRGWPVHRLQGLRPEPGLQHRGLPRDPGDDLHQGS
jgi:uncharacterized protein